MTWRPQKIHVLFCFQFDDDNDDSNNNNHNNNAKFCTETRHKHPYKFCLKIFYILTIIDMLEVQVV
jgi:hypothetical protein